MKNIKRDLDDSLRPEYRRSDFGEMVRGKHATTQVEFTELVRLLIACIGEDESLTISYHSTGNQVTTRKRGDWTYEFDPACQVTLRFWLNDFENLDEAAAIPPRVIASRERLDLKDLLLQHVRNLKARVNELE